MVEEKVMKTKVSIVRTQNRTEGVKKAIDLLKSNPFQGKAVVLKPNFNSADPTPGSTHIDTLRSLISNIKEMGATRITLAELADRRLDTNSLTKKGCGCAVRRTGL